MVDVLKRAGPRVRITCGGGSRTKQSFKAMTDINTIVSRARTTGLVSHVNVKRPMYGDVSKMGSYQDALNLVNTASEMFMALPAVVRERFSHDPAELLVFLSDPKNRPEAVELGLLEPKPLKGDVGPVPRVVVVDKRPKGDADVK